MLWHVSSSVALAMPRLGLLLCAVFFGVPFMLSTAECCCCRRLEFGDCCF